MMNKFNYSYILAGIIVLSSCEREKNNSFQFNNIDIELIGNWYDTVPANPKGLRIYQLTINDNGAIKSKITAYGIPDYHTIQDISSWSEDFGFLKQNQDSLFIKIEKHTWWDSFYEMSPETEYNDKNNFKFWCTYYINNNTLETTYLSYPADAPIETKKFYTRGH